MTPNRNTQSNGWFIFDKATGLYLAFFFDEAAAVKFMNRQEKPCYLESWKLNHRVYEWQGKVKETL